MKGVSLRKQMKRRVENILAGFVMFAISVVCFIPAIIFFLALHFLNPNGFWQKFAIYGAGLWCLGLFQFVGLIFFFVFWYAILFKS
jgi:hypothetical protein